jgi:nitrite reductase/ring-hydroxylating ferredoxin subunit
MSDQRMHRLCRKGDVPASGICAVQAPGYEPLAICRVGASYHLIADTCSHGQASLSEGEVVLGQVVCPFHGGSFDVTTGLPTDLPCTIPIATYTLIEVGDEFFVAAKP